MMNEEVAAPAEGAEVASPASTTDAKETNTSVKTGGGCCSSTKKFFLYDSTRPEIQAFYFNQVRYALRETYPTTCIASAVIPRLLLLQIRMFQIMRA